MTDNSPGCTQIIDMSLRDILTEWGQTIQGLVQDVTNLSPYTQTGGSSRVSLLISTFTRGRRMFYFGLTLVLVSVLLLFWDQPSGPYGGGMWPGGIGHLLR